MKKIGIYPGNFQPPVRSHYEVYKKLKSLVNDNEVFIATTDREPIVDAPLNFGDKEQIWVRHGVPSSHIIKISSLPTDDVERAQDWRPIEIYNRFSSQYTIALIVLNEKEAFIFSRRKKNVSSDKMKDELKEIYDELARPQANASNKNPSPEMKKNEPDEKIQGEVWLDTKDKPQYFQPYKTNENVLKSINEHAYIVVMDDTKIQGSPISTDNIKVVLGSTRYNEGQRKKFFRWAFGWFDVGLYQLMVYKFRNAHQVAYPSDVSNNNNKTPPVSTGTNNTISQQPIQNPKRKIQEIVREILKKLVDEDYSSTTTTATSGNTSPSDSSNTSTSTSKSSGDINKQKQDLIKQKRELESKAKQNKQQRDNYDTTVKNYDKFQKKSDRDSIDSVNKQISAPTPPTSATSPIP